MNQLSYSILVTRTAVAVLLFGILYGVSSSAVLAESQEKFTVLWALWAMEADTDELSSIKADTKLASTSKLKFELQPMGPVTVYVILMESSGAVHELYRQSHTEALPFSVGIPSGDDWIQLQQSSRQDTFFILFSVDPLTEFELLLDRLATEKQEQRADLAEQIFSTIRKLQKAHRDFSNTVEKPSMIGGQLRGPVDEVQAMPGIEITAEKFYSKTITIEH